MKRFIAVALLTAILFVTGCSAEPMQPVDYAQAVMDNAQDYFDIVDSLTVSANEALERSEYRTHRKEAEAILKTVERLTPPVAYSELHDKLCSGIEKEREWLALVEDLRYSANGKESELAAEINELVSDPVFPATVLEIAKAVDNDTDGAFLDSLK